MLEDLKVLNGELSLEFDSLNSKYTIFLNNDDMEVDFQYNLSEGTQIDIQGNSNLKDDSTVVITVHNENASVDYYFTIYKENSQETTSAISDFISVDVSSKEEVSMYAGPGIACICFLFILFLFTFLFHKRRLKKE